MDKSDLKSLSQLSDDELLVRLTSVLKDSRRSESVLVAHIAEVDARRLYAREASPSMHKYCTDVLHLSEAEAYFRITAARASRRHPVLLTMLEDGRLHLSGIEVLAPHLERLGEGEQDALSARATHKTKRELKELVAELAPKPDVPPGIRKVPERGKQEARAPRAVATTGAPTSPHQLCPDRVAPRAARPSPSPNDGTHGNRLSLYLQRVTKCSSPRAPSSAKSSSDSRRSCRARISRP